MTQPDESLELTTRSLCKTCRKPNRACLCAFITPISNTVELCILQHANEAQHAKNTAILLQLSLSACNTLVSSREETFDDETLQEALYKGGRIPILLYPPYDESDARIEPPPALPSIEQSSLDNLRLVVIDATWRKSRKLLYLHPQLQHLPRWSVLSSNPSIYKIRKADSENQLSTLEASCYALGQLEEMPSRYYPLLQAMTQFVDQRLAFSRQSTSP